MTPVICRARWSSPRCNTPAMSRADMAEPSRRDFWLCVDEIQNFATESFATILSEGGSLLAFQTGCRDAKVLAEQFGGDLKSDAECDVKKAYDSISERAALIIALTAHLEMSTR